MTTVDQTQKPNYLLIYRDEDADWSRREEHHLYAKDEVEARRRADIYIRELNEDHQRLINEGLVASDDWRRFTFLDLERLS